MDGYPDLSKDVLEKYKDDISVLAFEENRGMATAINYGVYNATNEYVLVVSEDNVFCKDWDHRLKENVLLRRIFENHSSMETIDFVYTINQIEPSGPSIYNFHIKDYGKTLEEFEYEKFLEEEETNISTKEITDDGGTFPFVMQKIDFMRVGGFDTDYQSPFVVDWDFFLKCELSGITPYRTDHLNFYHFVSKSTKHRDGYIETATDRTNFFEGENQAAEYFQYKWGFPPHRDKNNRCKQFIPFNS